MSIKITNLEIENVKRVKAVSLTPAQDGLTVIGGRNRQGKTSILDSIAWALGGDKYRPSMAQNDTSDTPPMLRVELSNGIIVERKGKNSDLKVTDPNGKKAGQQLLNSFIEQLALDLPKFMEASGKEKAQTLLKIIGVGDQLAVLDAKEEQLYAERTVSGRIADQKKKYADGLPSYPDAPKEPVRMTELMEKQKGILSYNEAIKLRKEKLGTMKAETNALFVEAKNAKTQSADIQRQIEELQKKKVELDAKAATLTEKMTAKKAAVEKEIAKVEALVPKPMDGVEKEIAEAESVNRKVSANADKAKAEKEAKEAAGQYEVLTGKIEETRKAKKALLEGARLPLPGLSVEGGELTYNGQQWDNMSSSEQLMVSTAIVRELNPSCGFVLVDKLEQMDLDTMQEFGAWLEKEGLQAIATRVSTGGECSIIISDGYVAGATIANVKVSDDGADGVAGEDEELPV